MFKDYVEDVFVLLSPFYQEGGFGVLTIVYEGVKASLLQAAQMQISGTPAGNGSPET